MCGPFSYRILEMIMSDNLEVRVEIKPKLKAKVPRKIRIVMKRNYRPADEGFKGQLDGLGRLPKGQMVEVSKKLGDQLIANGIAVVANA